MAFLVAAAGISVVWLAFRSGRPEQIEQGPARGELVLEPRVTAVVPVGPNPRDIAVGEGAVWVSVPAQRADQNHLVVRIDPQANEVVAQIPVEDYLDELAAGEGGVWGVGVEGSGDNVTLSVVRIDPATNEVAATIPNVSGPLAVGQGALWAVDRAGARAGPEGSSLLRIDPETDQVVGKIPLGVAAWDIEVGEGYIWVLTLEPEPGEGDILQIDPTTNEIEARIEMPVRGSVFSPALGEGSAWVPVCCVDNQLALTRIDVSSGQIVGEPFTLQATAPFAAAAGHVWLLDERGGVYGLNVATSEVDEGVSGFEWPVGSAPDPSAELDPGELVVWVANYRDSVTRIDLQPATEPAATITLPDLSPFASAGGMIVFSDNGTEGWDIFAMTPDGSYVVPLIEQPGAEFLPRLSQDGTLVAYVSIKQGPHALHVVDLATGESRLIHRFEPGQQVIDLAWSPDGTRMALALESDPATPDSESHVFVLDVARGDIQRITDVGRDNSVDWSPDGSSILFTRSGSVAGEGGFVANDLYVISPDGTGERRLTTDGLSMHGSWSSDGRRIVFESYEPSEGAQTDIYVMESDGSGRGRLTDDPGMDYYPVWSPDGSSILFVSRRSDGDPSDPSSCHLMVVRADGSGERSLISDQSRICNGNPSWSE